jgi:putative ABC transport system ATP-binding protein
MVTHEAEMAAYARRIVRFIDGRIDHDGAPAGASAAAGAG